MTQPFVNKAGSRNLASELESCTWKSAEVTEYVMDMSEEAEDRMGVLNIPMCDREGAFFTRTHKETGNRITIERRGKRWAFVKMEQLRVSSEDDWEGTLSVTRWQLGPGNEGS